MTTSIKIIGTLAFLIICMATIHAQSSDNKLNRVWELNSVEPLTDGIGGLGEEMKRLDLRSETQLVLEGGGQSDTVSYKVIDQEIRLFDKEGNHLGQDIIWQIEQLTAHEFSLLFIAKEDNKKLTRLKYRARG